MKIVLHLLLILLPVSISNSFIDWKAGYRLVWDDFKEKPDASSPNAALTSTAIRFDFRYADGRLTYHVSCQFDKSRSWGRVKTDYILSHEQGHFDIAEINARKLFKALKGYSVTGVNTINKDLNKLYETSMRELHDMQSLYDAETNFSINKTEQGLWLIKIGKELENLNAYADYH